MTCQCPGPQFCHRYGRQMTPRLWQMCQGTSGLPKEVEEAYMASLKKDTDPSLIEKGLKFTAAFINHLRQGLPRVNDEMYATRLVTCSECPSCDKENWKCNECGCNLKEGALMPGKARWASEDCPKGLWPKIELPVVTGGCGGCQKK